MKAIQDSSEEETLPMVNNELSTKVYSPLCALNYWLEVLEHLCQERIVLGSVCMGGNRRPTTMDLFYATERTLETPTRYDDHEGFHEVLELVLTQNHLAGDVFSQNYAVVIENADQDVFMPKTTNHMVHGILQKVFESAKDLANLFSLNRKSRNPGGEEEEEDEDRDYRLVRVERTSFEMLLGHEQIDSEEISPKISLFVRKASHEEVRPYQVKLHPSHQSYQEKILNAWTHSNETCNETCNDDEDEKKTPSVDSEDAEMKIPDLIEVEVSKTSRSQEKIFDEPWKQRGVQKEIWIPDNDVVLGAGEQATSATGVFYQRVLPIYAFKKKVTPANITVMKLMLKEELKEEAKAQKRGFSEPSFWVKTVEAECSLDEDDEKEEAENSDTKFLRREDGDFIGPFVKACNRVIRSNINSWKADHRNKSTLLEENDPPVSATSRELSSDDSTMRSYQSRDPEPSVSNVYTQAPLDKVSTEDATPPISEEKEERIVTPTFKLTGPIGSLDGQARVTCQDWLNDSETKLVKAAKKCCIEAFHSDFQAFLFLFQLQIKRIKDRQQASKESSGAKESHSWVTCDPSDSEEDFRIASVEKACIDFMNQIGNDMVKHYEMLSKDSRQEMRDDQRTDTSQTKAEAVSERQRAPLPQPIQSPLANRDRADTSSKNKETDGALVSACDGNQKTTKRENASFLAAPSRRVRPALRLAASPDSRKPNIYVQTRQNLARTKLSRDLIEQSRGQCDMSYSLQDDETLDTTSSGSETDERETTEYEDDTLFSGSFSYYNDDDDEEEEEEEEEETFDEDDSDNGSYPTHGVDTMADTLSPSELSFEDDPEKLKKHWVFQDDWIPHWL